jgi:hypothetical protein
VGCGSYSRKLLAWEGEEQSEKGIDGSYRDSPEGLVDLLGSEALLVEEGSAVGNRGAPDLGVGEELDGVVDVVLPHRLLEHQLVAPGSLSVWCWCCSWIRGTHRIRHKRGEENRGKIGFFRQFNSVITKIEPKERINRIGGRYQSLGIAGRSRRPWRRASPRRRGVGRANQSSPNELAVSGSGLFRKHYQRKQSYPFFAEIFYVSYFFETNPFQTVTAYP